MKKLKETIKVKSNQSRRTFTIRRTFYDGSIIKYRTIPMSKEEFENEEMNTENDWKNFLRRSDDYYKVN